LIATGVDDVAVADGEAQSAIAGSVSHGDASERCAGNRPFDLELHAIGETGDAADEYGIRPADGGARRCRRYAVASGCGRHSYHEEAQTVGTDDGNAWR
jgi:hypothetical protein